jgi:hypothetical protein
MAEGEITESILVEASNQGARLFRQNTGMGWAGKLVSKRGGSVRLSGARPLRAGLTTGSSDIIGVMPVVITQEMVGKTIGVFTAVEVKYGRTPTTEEQEVFLRVVRNLGGIAFVAKSLGDYLAGVKAWIEKKREPSHPM